MPKDLNSDQLPKDWKWVKLSEICNVVRGGSPRPAGHPKYYNGDIPFLKVADITKHNGVYLNTFQYTIKEAGLHKTRKISPNTLLLSNSGATLGVPKICMINATINDGVAAFLDLDNRSNLFLYYFWLSKTRELRNINMGAAQPNLNTDIIKNYEILLPPLPTQKAIVSKIEELFSELDKGIENLRTAQMQLKTYRQAVLKCAFEGKLTAEWREENWTIVQVPAGLLDLSMAAEDEVVYEVKNKLPVGWKNVTLGELCTNVEYGSAAKSKEKGTIPVLRMGNIQNGRFDWSDLVYTDDVTEIEKYQLKTNDVLFNRTNSAELVGKTAIYKGERPAIFAGYLIRINRIENLLEANFLTYFLNSLEAKKYGNSVRSFGVNQSNINGTKLKGYPILLPPIQEQFAIVQEIESRLSVADKMEESINQSLQQAEALRQSILKKAFEGSLNSIG